MGMGELNEAFEVPKEFANAIERLDSEQVKRIVELMGQCVQVCVTGVLGCVSRVYALELEPYSI